MANNKSTNTFENIHELRKASGKESVVINILGQNTINDGGGGFFYWDPTSTLPDDGIDVVQKSGSIVAGRWIRLSSASSLPTETLDLIKEIEKDVNILSSNSILIKNSMDELRNISGDELMRLQSGFYKFVQLQGYYDGEKYDQPIDYFWDADSTADDDGGSVIQVTGVVTGRFQHDFKGEVDVAYFGCKPEGLLFDNAPALQKAADLKNPLTIRNSIPGSYYFINARIRLYNSITGVGMPQIKVNPEVTTFVPEPGYQIDRYTAFTVTNKLDDDFLYIQGLDIDGWYEGTSQTPSEFEHNIHLSCAKNVVIRGNILRNPCGDSIYLGKHTAGQGAPEADFCENIYIYNNRMVNQGRCGVAVVSARNVEIKSNYIRKHWTYVCPIDLEPNGESVDLLVQSIIIEDNTVIADATQYAINVYGASDSSYGADPYPAVDYSTKDVVIRNNILKAANEGVHLAASWGKLANISIIGNKIDAPAMVVTAGTYRSLNVVVENNTPLYDTLKIRVGTFNYCDKVAIRNNRAEAETGEGILVARSTDFLIEGNFIKTTGLIPSVRLANSVGDVKIVGNRFECTDQCIKINSGSSIDGFLIRDNYMRSEDNHIVFSDGVVIQNSKILENDWAVTATLKYLTNSPAFFPASESENFDGKRHFHVAALPSLGDLTNNEHGYVYTKKISSLAAYNASSPEADKYMYFNGSLIGVGFKGEWFGDGSSLPTTNTKSGHRYTNTAGTTGNTLFIREGSYWRAVQTIISGTTAQRPVDAAVGCSYFDVTIGAPVWWDGTAWVRIQAEASGDTATMPGATYSQAEVQDILDELRDLKLKLRDAGILAT